MFGQQMERGCGSYSCETGVVSLSRDPKPRLRWTPDLHDRFVDAVTKLGGPHSDLTVDGQDENALIVLKGPCQCGTVIRSYSQIGSESDGSEGIDIIPFEEPFAGLLKYRLGKQAKKEAHQEENQGNSESHSYSNSPGTSSNTPTGNNEGEIPVAEALRYQIEAQRQLHEQLEVQKKLQMRIEAQGKYLQAILEKAQKSLSSDTNNPGSLEATRAQLTDFNLALSGFMENINQAGEVRNGDLGKSIFPDNYAKTQNPVLQLYQGDQKREKQEVKHEVEDGSILFDLNVKGSHELFGTNGSDLDLKMHTWRR